MFERAELDRPEAVGDMPEGLSVLFFRSLSCL
jgi:hypothetical protein